jgi:hypothetical protein
MELVACLLVPSPGYAMGHQEGPTATWNDQGALVASSVPVLGPAAQRHPLGSDQPDLGRFGAAADAIAASIGVGRADRLAEAVAMVESDPA